MNRDFPPKIAGAVSRFLHFSEMKQARSKSISDFTNNLL